MRYGTCCFVSLGYAALYYGSRAIARGKLEANEIRIGKPTGLPPGARVSVIPGEGRYQVED